MFEKVADFYGVLEVMYKVEVANEWEECPGVMCSLPFYMCETADGERYDLIEKRNLDLSCYLIVKICICRLCLRFEDDVNMFPHNATKDFEISYLIQLNN